MKKIIRSILIMIIMLWMVYIPILILAYAKTWMIVAGFIVALILWVKEVLECE